jgi:hypothetical protein
VNTNSNPLRVPKLASLQEALLKRGLHAYYRAPLDIACHLDNPGCFGLKSMMRDFENRRVRATRRAAAGLSIARLIKKGLLQCYSRGHWRLSAAGLAVARRLYPEVKAPTERQPAADIALRKAISAYGDAHPALCGKRPDAGRGMVPQSASLNSKEKGRVSK